MRFQRKSSKDIKGPLCAVISAAEWKSGKWLGALPKETRARIEKARARLEEPLEAGGMLHVPALEKGEESVLVALTPAEKDAFFLLEFARDTVKGIVTPKTRALTLWITDEDRELRLADAFGSALSARVFEMPLFGARAAKRKPFALENVYVHASSARAVETVERGAVLGDGTNLARYLATLPPNVLDPGTYGERIRKLCREHGLKYKFHSNRQLKKMGAGAFTAVDQGNPHSEGGIHELSYSPKKKGKGGKPVTLVGKGVCFDTGGYDVKVSGGMMTMKGDMQGSSVALAGVVTAARLGFPRPVKAFLGVTENHLSPHSYTPDEIITALNGRTIEVVNTDAEGRMVLADTLTLASKDSPAIVIDFATLTGAAMRALGTKYSAGFTNLERLHQPIVDAGAASGERVWTFPLDATYARALESKVADTLQCLKGGGPDHIYAAAFLSKFVKENVPWVHVDLSASENDGGLAHVDSLFTGFGVRWLFSFLGMAKL